MADRKRTVSIVIEARNLASSVLRSLGLSLTDVAVAAGVVTAAAGAAAYAITKITEAAAKQEDADVRLAVALASIGANTAATRQSLGELATQLQDQTTLSDESIQELMATLIQLGRVGVTELPRVTRAAIELAAVTGSDLATAGELMARAAQGQTQALTRYGIVLDEALPKSQKFAALLAMFDDGMSTATASGQTLSGQIRRLGNDYEELLQATGKAVVESEQFRAILDLISDALKRATAFVTENRDQVDHWVRSLTDAFLALAEIGLSAVDLAAGLAKADLEIRKFTGRFTGSSGYGEAMARLDRTLIEIAEHSAPLLRKQIEDLRITLASIPPASPAKSLDDLLQVMHKTGAGAVDVAGKIKNFGKPVQETKGTIQQLDQALKDLGITSTASLKAQSDAFDRAVDLALKAQGELAHPELMDPIVESLLKASEAVVTWGEDFRDIIPHITTIRDTMFEVESAATDAATQAAVDLGDAFVDAAFGARRSWADTIKSILAGIAKAILKALILKAIEFGFGGGGLSAGEAGSFNPFTGAVGASGGDVRGGIPGLDSVRAMLMPGEIVLPRSRAEDFSAIAGIAKSSRAEGGEFGVGGRDLHFHLTVATLDRRRIAGDLIDSLNEAVERRGYRLIASEVRA